MAHISGNSLRNLGDLLGREIAGNLGDLRGGHHSNTPKVSDFLRSNPPKTQNVFTYFSKGVILAVSDGPMARLSKYRPPDPSRLPYMMVGAQTPPLDAEMASDDPTSVKATCARSWCTPRLESVKLGTVESQSLAGPGLVLKLFSAAPKLSRPRPKPSHAHE